MQAYLRSKHKSKEIQVSDMANVLPQNVYCLLSRDKMLVLGHIDPPYQLNLKFNITRSHDKTIDVSLKFSDIQEAVNS